MPFFSIVIPLYNKENFIADTIESVLLQTFDDFEIIIIDDGSTDNSASIIKTFNDKRIRYYFTPNQKVSKARNKGISLAEGKIIALLDADDYWEPEHLQVLHDLYLQYPEAGILASRYAIKMSDRKIVYATFKDIDDNYSGIVNDFFKSSLTYRIATASTAAVPKEVFNVIGNFNTNITRTEDTELYVRIALQYPVAISNKYTARYNFDLPDSLSKTKIRNNVIFNFNDYALQEANNSSLKAFLDLYRIEHALKFKIEGDTAKATELYKAVAPGNINAKTKILFNLPPFILRNMLRLKHWLVKKGITFSIYN